MRRRLRRTWGASLLAGHRRAVSKIWTRNRHTQTNLEAAEHHSQHPERQALLQDLIGQVPAGALTASRLQSVEPGQRPSVTVAGEGAAS